MARLVHPLFPHRHNANDRYDSICADCFATVATAETEDQLLLSELDHICDPIRLYCVSQSRRSLDAPQSRQEARRQMAEN
jgi:hypothetical protein